MKPHLIAFYSPAPQSGKSTIAKYLRERHGFTRMAFAEPIKHMLDGFLDWYGYNRVERRDMLHGSRKDVVIPALGCSPRHLMQTLGTEWGRELVSQNVWAQAVVSRVRKSFTPVVIDDLRFPNELEAVLSQGGWAVKVVRPGAELTSAHASEGALESFDAWRAVIVNDGPIEALHARVDELLRDAWS